MSRRATRKTIDYSQFNDERQDYSGSDDDFQDSPNAPPAKRTKTSAKSCAKDKKITSSKVNDKKRSAKDNNTATSTKATKTNRDSPGEKHFERELQAALEFSKKQISNVILIVDDGSSVDTTVEGSCIGNNEDPKPEATKQGVLDDTEKSSSVLSKVIGPSEADDDDDEFKPSSNEDNGGDDDDDDDSDDDDDDVDDDENFDVESGDDEEFKVPNKRHKKGTISRQVIRATAKGGGKKNKSNISRQEKKPKEITSRAKHQVQKSAVKVIGAALTPGLSMPNVETSSSGLRVGLKSPHGSGGLKSSAASSVGKSSLISASRLTSASRSSPVLGGVSLKSSGRTGIRLGLSRNIRVSKPLHATVSLKSS